MSGGFAELENITADLGLKAWGPSVQDAFASAARGLAQLIADPPASALPLTRKIQIDAPNLPSLLVRFLNEIIYLQETEGFLPGDVTSLEITDNNLEAILKGVIFDPKMHNINAHIKAATYHGLEIGQEKGEVRIKVIFDV
ncbi:MAG: archease [Pseudomonadota bacterium]|jgi:SHS2 domain-containing protein